MQHPDPTDVPRSRPAAANLDETATTEKEEARPARVRTVDVAIILLLALWVIGTRLPYVSDFVDMSKDGSLYINSLSLDHTYNVPMPGNLGVVLLGKGANQVLADPLDAYEAVEIGLTILAVAFCYLVAALVVPRPLAAATAFALSTNTIVWWYGEVVASYLVWLAILPAVGWFGFRFAQGRRTSDLVGASVALAAGMVLRPDLLVFGTPLWFGSLLLGRAPIKSWLLGGAILAAGCACWFFGTAAVLGGLDTYLDRVHAKHVGDIDGFSFVKRGLVEGLLRNSSKYVLFLVWSAPLVLLPFLWGVLRDTLRLSTHWREMLLAALWVGPSWYFSFFVFAGTAGLIFPFLPLVYIGAAKGLNYAFGARGAWRPAIAMTLLGLATAAQFTLTPLVQENDQRHVILNVTFLRYSGAGLQGRYNYNLDNYGVCPSLTSVLHQMRSPEPIPVIPPSNGLMREASGTRQRVSAR